MIASIGCCVGMSTPQVHIIPLCIDQGLSIITGGKILSIMLFCAVLSRIMFGYISDIIGPLKTLLIGSTLQMMTFSIECLLFESESSSTLINHSAILFFSMSPKRGQMEDFRAQSARASLRVRLNGGGFACSSMNP